ncbi:hypothetical protein [Actinomadura rudentiformis]|uniref:Uncharacterized protein n=1 Tax=Actinomadura rudentiformis TaxID=359158 RepID=A0A6H9Z210_9ACTN|nr:hypothetical protein [Actinomadura rudentiformis]KAB2348588.1 hypothetical protein F8566_17620 [Actinomadura rudentiformis]
MRAPTIPSSWYENRYREPPRYETLLEKLAPTQLERQRLLKAYFEPSAEDLEAGRKSRPPRIGRSRGSSGWARSK